MFERVSILSAGWGTTSLRRSIERLFDLEERIMTAATLTRPARTRPAATRRAVTRPAVARHPIASTRASGSACFGAPVRALPVARPVRARRVRVTRRGRLVLVLVAAVALLVLISFGRTGSQAATATGTGPSLQQATVQPGETLWAVAQRIAPKNDPREVIAQIRRINHLGSSALRAGQQLLLPVAG
jgi:hypothetical protein